MKRLAAALLAALLAASLTFGAGLALGALSRGFYLIGLVPLVVGALAGGGVTFVALMTSGPWGRAPRVSALAAVVVGAASFHVADDLSFQAAYRDDVGRARAIADQVPPELLRDRDAAGFVAQDADALLEAAVVAAVGRGGASGRWLFRSDRGVRLVGPLVGGRGLPLGRWGAAVAALAELALAFWLASRIVRRVEHTLASRAAAEGQALASPGEVEDLDEERREEGGRGDEAHGAGLTRRS